MEIFTCESCCHAIIENDEQTGCKLDKLSKIPSVFNKSTKFFNLEKVCAYKNNDPENIKIKVGYIFILKDPDKIQELKNNINSVKDMNPLWIGVNHDFPEIKDDINKYLMSLNIPYNIILNYEKVAGDIYRLDQFMKNYKNGWTLVNIIGEKFDIDKYKILNTYVNHFNPLAIVKNKCDSVNELVFFNMIFKYLKGSYPSILEDETIEQKTIIEKVEDMSSYMVKNWKELYEFYSDTSS